MSRRNETNGERLARHRADLERCLLNRKKLNERIARLEERIVQEENQEYLAVIHGASISLEELQKMIKDKMILQASIIAERISRKTKENQENEAEDEPEND